MNRGGEHDDDRDGNRVENRDKDGVAVGMMMWLSL